MLTLRYRYPDLSPEEQLTHIRRVQRNGCQESWSAILAQFSPIVMRIARFRCQDSLRCEEKESALLFKLVKAIRYFDPDRGVQPFAYVVRALKNPINESEFSGPVYTPEGAYKKHPEAYGRATGASIEIDGEEGFSLACDFDLVSTAISNETVEIVRQAIDQLNERSQLVIRRRMNGVPLREIAAEMGVSIAYVHQIETKARSDLREILNPETSKR